MSRNDPIENFISEKDFFFRLFNRNFDKESRTSKPPRGGKETIKGKIKIVRVRKRPCRRAVRTTSYWIACASDFDLATRYLHLVLE